MASWLHDMLWALWSTKKIVAIEIHRRAGGNADVPIDFRAAGQSHGCLVADVGQRYGQSCRFEDALRFDIFHPLCHQHAARAAGAEAMAIGDLVDAGIEGHAGLEGFLAKIGPRRNLNFLFFIDKRDNGH